MSNEIMVNANGEVVETNLVVQETENYVIERLPNGKFKKSMKYKEVASSKPSTEEEKIKLFQVFNDDDCKYVTPMKNMIGEEFLITDYYTKPYTSFDENTGNNDYGVVTTLKNNEGSYITTSSKSVYFALQNMVQAFELPFRVKVVGTKKERGIQINISFVGTK